MTSAPAASWVAIPLTARQPIVERTAIVDRAGSRRGRERITQRTHLRTHAGMHGKLSIDDKAIGRRKL